MSLSFLSFSFFSVCFNWRDTLISIFFMSSKAFSYLLLNVTQRTVTEDVRWWGGDLLLWPPFTQPACTDQVSTEDSRGWPGWESHSFALSDSLLHYSGLWRPSGNSPGDQEIRILSFFLPDLMLELPSFWTIGLYNLKEDWIDISLIYYMGNWFLKSKVLKKQIFTLWDSARNFHKLSERSRASHRFQFELLVWGQREVCKEALCSEWQFHCILI